MAARMRAVPATGQLRHRSDGSSGAFRQRASRRGAPGQSSGSAAVRIQYGGKPGMKMRRNVPPSTLTSGELPLKKKNAQNHAPRKTAAATDRRATPIAPAIGTHSAGRGLQKNSRNWATLSFSCCQLRLT